jgi:hypothetical protein
MEVVVQLERALDELARRCDRFLGHEPGATMPGVAEIDALEQRIRQAALGHAASPAEQARLAQLSSRFGTKAGGWRQLARAADQECASAQAPKPATRLQAAPTPPKPAASAVAPAPARGSGAAAAGPSTAGISPARMEEYRHLFARYQAVMERAGETLPTSLERFVRELEEQRKRLEDRGTLVVGFDIVREASGVHVRPRTRSRSG